MIKKFFYKEMYDPAAFIQPYLYGYLTNDICPSRLGIKRIDKNRLFDLLVKRMIFQRIKLFNHNLLIMKKNDFRN